MNDLQPVIKLLSLLKNLSCDNIPKSIIDFFQDQNIDSDTKIVLGGKPVSKIQTIIKGNAMSLRKFRPQTNFGVGSIFGLYELVYRQSHIQDIVTTQNVRMATIKVQYLIKFIKKLSQPQSFTAKLLEKNKILAQLRPLQIQYLASCATPRSNIMGDFIISKGDQLRQLYFIVKGQVQLTFKTNRENKSLRKIRITEGNFIELSENQYQYKPLYRARVVTQAISYFAFPVNLFFSLCEHKLKSNAQSIFRQSLIHTTTRQKSSQSLPISHQMLSRERQELSFFTKAKDVSEFPEVSVLFAKHKRTIQRVPERKNRESIQKQVMKTQLPKSLRLQDRLHFLLYFQTTPLKKKSRLSKNSFKPVPIKNQIKWSSKEQLRSVSLSEIKHLEYRKLQSFSAIRCESKAVIKK